MLYQNTTIDTTKLIIGNCKIETAVYGTSAASATGWTNLGCGIVNEPTHNLVKFDTQCGNGPDPIEGIADETFTVSGELIEFDTSVLAAISCGALTSSAGSGSGQTIINAGGNTDLTARAFKITNRRLISGVTQSTVILLYKATIDNGLQFSLKSDNDTDPVSAMPFSITAKKDDTLTAGSQYISSYSYL